MITERVELQQDVSRPAGLAAKAVEKLAAALAKLGAFEVAPGMAGQLRAVEAAAARVVGSKKAASEGEREIVRQMREEAKLAAKLANFDEKREKNLAWMRKELRDKKKAVSPGSGDLGPALPRTLVPTLGGMLTFAGGQLITKAGEVAVQIAARIGQAFVDGARAAFQAATFRQATEKGLSVVLRSAEKAKAVYDQGIRLADELGAGAKETLSGLHSLIALGFPVDEAVLFTKAMADLQVVNPAANIEALMGNIGKIKSQGKLQGDELTNMGEAGLNLSKVYELLAKQAGKTVPEIQKMISAGQVTAEMALPAILDSVKALTDKPLGDVAKEASFSLGGMAKRLENVGDLLYRADFGAASQNIEDFARPLLALIGPGTQTSKAVSEAIESLASALTGLLGGEAGAEKTAASIEKMAAFGTGAAEGIKQIDWAMGKLKGTTEGLDASTIEKIGTAVVWVAALVVGGVAAVGMGVYAMVYPLIAVYDVAVGWWADMKAFFSTATSEAGASGTSIGSALVTGLVAALTGGLSLVVDAAARLVGGAVDAGRGPKGADAHSPSRKMVKLGGDMADGLPIGMERQLSSVRSSAAGMISGLINTAPPANQNGIGSRSAGGGGVVVHVHLDGGAVAAAGGPAAAEAMGARAGNAAAEAYIRRMREAS